MAGKLYIKTFGCQMNEYDSARTVQLLEKTHGMTRTFDPREADVLLVNTCSVREKAAEKLFSEVGRWKNWKIEKPDLVIGVGGCVASQEGVAIQKRAPYVDLVYGPQTIHRVPDLIRRVQRTRKSQIDISFPEIEKFDCLPPACANGPTAFVSVMEGCSKYCSFCVVPYTRGEEFSRPFDDVINEVVKLARQGVREVTFLGQNVNAYSGEMFDGGTADLALLISYASVVEGIARLRYTTSHPAEFGDDLIAIYGEVPELANHLHLPVQSGSDRILKKMKRPYTVDDYRRRIAKLKSVRPGISVSSDFIVGFPGETDLDFEETINLVKEIGFDQSFSFIYSPRPGTPAAELLDNVDISVKKARLASLQDLITRQANQISVGMVGNRETVLVEKVSKKRADQISGRTENNRVVNFDGPPSCIGKFVEVEITEALPNSLRGELVSIKAYQTIN